MALIRDYSRAQLAFQISGGEPDQFLVNRYRGTEGLCQLYRFEIELAAAATDLAFDDVVGQAAVLSINTEKGTRWFHGIISRFEMTGETHEQMYFRVELVPTVWLLTHRYSSRIFQNKKVPDIISDVLTKGGIPSDRVRLELEGTYDPREYCAQYRETDYNFICRLMEEEGIWWYFEQTEESHVLVIADATSSYEPIGEECELPYQPPSGMKVEDEHVFRFRLGQSVRPGAVVLRDFNSKDPKLDLQATSDCGRDTDLEFSDFPGEYETQGDGQRLASLRAEEFESTRILAVAQSNSYRISPARTFDLIEHPSEPTNQTYMITSVTHQGKQATTRASTGANGRGSLLDSGIHQSLLQARNHENTAIRDLAEALLQITTRIKAGDQTAHRELTRWLYHAGQVSREMSNTAGVSGSNPLEALAVPNLLDDLARSTTIEVDGPVYECRFECIPASVTFRPPRVTPWPVMRGSQTARVVGPEGEEIHTDEYGRVRVQFNWDREGGHKQDASCWIRVSQNFAGGQYGIMFIPRVGQEVIVDFLEGNPDLPVITGRVYNADHMPPYPLPAEKTKSVIKTRSTTGGGGSHEIRFEDLKDSEQMLIYGQKDLHIRFKNDRVENIEANRSLTVGNSRFEEVKKDYHLKVKDGNRNAEIGGDESLAVGGKMSVKVSGTRSTEIGGDVVDKFGASHKHEVSMTYACKALAIKLEASTGIELKCGGSSIVLTPAAIFIMGGPLVNINSGAGPPVSPVMAMATSPEAPEAPAGADTVEHGKDTTYAGGEELEPAETPAEVAGETFEPEETEETEASWIDIELIDEEGMPVPGERYRVTDSEGTVKEGTLDANGRAHVTGIAPGPCEITFPRLDLTAWQRAQ